VTDKVGILFSENEPYDTYLSRLRHSVRRRRLACQMICLERLAVGPRTARVCDILVPCTNHPQTASVVSVIESQGIQVLNRGVRAAALNRVTINTSLHSAGISTPQFWISPRLSQLLRQIPESAYPIVVKSPSVPKAQINVLRDSEEFRHHILRIGTAAGLDGSLFYAEQLLHTDDTFIKVYICGSDIACYRKFSDFLRKPETVATTKVFRKLALQSRKALDLDFLSLDAVSYEGAFAIVDVNVFPIFKYHTDAYDWLANAIYKLTKSSR